MVDLPNGVAAVLTRSHPFRGMANQDAATVFPVHDNAGLIAVADGMGGTRGGGTAAGTLVSYLADQVASTSLETKIRTSILNCVECVNDYLLENVPDAGTTLAAIEIQGHTVRPYHIGDSEIYVVGQRGKLKLKIVPHSPVGIALQLGQLTEEEALHHPDRNLIMNAVGYPEMRIELGARLELARHDTVLLASDGLTDNVRLDESIACLCSGPLDQAVRKLADLATERMSGLFDENHPSKPDDLTIIAYRRSS